VKTPIAADLMAIGVPATKSVSRKNVASQVSSAKQALRRQDYIGPKEMTVRVEFYSNDLINFIELAWTKIRPRLHRLSSDKSCVDATTPFADYTINGDQGIFANNEGT
jgi:hypothetical protein